MVATQSFRSKRGLALLLSLLLWLSASVVLATPVGLAFFDLEKRKEPFPSIQDCKAKFKAPPKDKAMYFTGLKGKKDIKNAIEYAENNDMVHVRQSYPKFFIDIAQYEGTDEERRTFQENFSKLYAEATEGVAYLMIDDSKSPADDSIFKTVAFPAMRDGAKVSKILRFPITATDPKKSNKEFWPDDADAACMD